jgi:drug/metabolite transporter (DMT)-like permease
VTARPRPLLLTAFAMTAFAGNSLLCRLALRPGTIDPASFAAVRIASGALLLAALFARKNGGLGAILDAGSRRSAFALAVYAVCFSFAYVGLDAGTGTLALFGAVQVTMIGSGLARGERPPARSWVGFAAAVAGLALLALPGAGAPDPAGLLAMAAAGAAWGVYSLRGRGARDPGLATAGNFALAVPWVLIGLAVPLLRGGTHVEPRGAWLAIASGTVTSGLGYVVWYAALRGLAAVTAAIVQLSVPVIAALGGIVLLGERPGLRVLAAAALVLGGIALVVAQRRAR